MVQNSELIDDSSNRFDTPSSSDKPKYPNKIVWSIALIILASSICYLAYQFGKQSVIIPMATCEPVTQVALENHQAPAIETIQTDTGEKQVYLPIVKMRFILPERFLGLAEPISQVDNALNDTALTGTSFCVRYQQKQISFVSDVNAGGPECEAYSNDLLLIGGVTRDYSNPTESVFLDNYGFTEIDNQYYIRYPVDRLVPIDDNKFSKIKNNKGVDILIIKDEKNDPIEDGHYPLIGAPGEEWIAAVVNTNHPIYPGFGIQMRVTDQQTEAEFLQLVQSLRFVGP